MYVKKCGLRPENKFLTPGSWQKKRMLHKNIKVESTNVFPDETFSLITLPERLYQQSLSLSKECDQTNVVLHLICRFLNFSKSVMDRFVTLMVFTKSKCHFSDSVLNSFLNKNKLLFLMDGRPSASERL